MRIENVGPGLFLIIYQALLLILLPLYFVFFTPSLTIVAITFVLYFATGLSITAGYHRLWSHKAFKANHILEWITLFFGTMASQGSVIRWCFDHRLHHSHVDTDNDPYSIKKGFWYAHFLWILEKPRPIDPKVVSDLLRKKELVFQDKHYPYLMVASNFLMFLLVGWLTQDYVGAFVLTWWARMFLLHHSTWFINSLAHTWGDKPFDQEQSAVNNYIISLLTFGEGYHNYHHTFASDYRNGIKWFHYDPTKWLIWGLSKLKLAYSLRQMDPLLIEKKMVLERKNQLLKRIKSVWYLRSEELEMKVQEVSNGIIDGVAHLKQLREKYRSLKKNRTSREMLKEIRRELSERKREIRRNWKMWVHLSRQIMRLQNI